MLPGQGNRRLLASVRCLFFGTAGTRIIYSNLIYEVDTIRAAAQRTTAASGS